MKSNMTPRLQTSEEGKMRQPVSSSVVGFGATTKSSFLLLLSLSRLVDIHILISFRQLTSDCGGSKVEGSVLR